LMFCMWLTAALLNIAFMFWRIG
jgi:hypothetical protein